MSVEDEEKRQKARQRKKRKALARLRKTLDKSKQLSTEDEFTDWENEFATSLEQRLETFDSAFIDPDKGRPDEALSYRQAAKLKQIEDKAKGKPRKPWNQSGGFGTKKPKKKYGIRSLIAEKPEPETDPPRPTGPPTLSVIKGGKDR